MQYEAIAELRPERDVLRCLPESDDAKRALIAHQGALGIGAYDDGLFVGSPGRSIASSWAFCAFLRLPCLADG